MNLYTAEGWTDFLVASAGAAGALTGLVFLGITINVQQIISYPGLPARAASTLIVLMNALIIALVALMPVTSHVSLGLALLLVSLVGWGAIVFAEVRNREQAPDVREHRRGWLVMSQLGTVPFIVAGISILASGGGGMYWVVAGVCLALVVGLTNGWVLLIEILR